MSMLYNSLIVIHIIYILQIVCMGHQRQNQNQLYLNVALRICTGITIFVSHKSNIL